MGDLGRSWGDEGALYSPKRKMPDVRNPDPSEGIRNNAFLSFSKNETKLFFEITIFCKDFCEKSDFPSRN